MILQTARLTLRPLQMGDAASLFAILGDAQAMRFWHRPPLPRLATVQAQLADELAAMAAGGFFYWTVVKDGDAIGSIDLSHIENGAAQTGFLFRRDQWGRGYAREAMTAVIGQALGALRLDELSALAHRDNLRAASLLARLEFQAEDGPGEASRFILRRSAMKKGA